MATSRTSLSRDLLCDVVGFRDETVDRWTLHSLRRLAELLEYLVKPRDLVPRLFEVIAQALAQVAVCRLIDELWQRFHDLQSRLRIGTRCHSAR
jgi:hypothetical protein